MKIFRTAALGGVVLGLAYGCSSDRPSDTASAPVTPTPASTAERSSKPIAPALTTSPRATSPRAPDCTCPTFEITELYHARAWPSTGQEDATYPMFLRFTIHNPGEHAVEVYAMDTVVNLRPTPEARPLMVPDEPQPMFFAGTQIGTTLHPPVLEPGESFDDQWSTFGDPYLVVVGGKATVDIARLHYEFTDENVEESCAPLRPAG